MTRSPRLLSDERLATLAGGGSDPAFAVLYRRFDGVLHGYCLSIVKNPEDARDVLQSAWMKALVALRAQSRKAPVRPWLFRIVHNEAIDLIRRRRGDEPLIDHERVGGTAGGADDEVVGRERMAEVVADLRELPEGQRAALVMREWADFEYAEIATALETSEGNARQLVFSARSGLVESRTGRDESCDVIRLELAGADGRRLRNRRIRSHLDTCEACRAFSTETRDRRRAAAAALLPWGPSGAELLGGLVTAGGAAGGAAGGSALLGSIAKGAAVAAAVVTGSVGSAELAIEPGGDRPVKDTAGAVEVAVTPSKREPSAAVKSPSDPMVVRGARRSSTATAGSSEPVESVVLVADRGAHAERGGARRDGDGRRRTAGDRDGAPRRSREQRGDDGTTRRPPPPDDGRRDGSRDGGDRWDDGSRHHAASSPTNFLRAPDGSHTGQ